MSIYRAPHAVEARLAATKGFSELVTKELEGRLSKNRKLAEQAQIISAPLSTLIRADEKAMSALRAVEPMIKEERDRHKSAARAIVRRPVRPFSITTNGSLIISVPPYDLWWKSGSVLFTEADSNAGTFKAETVDDLGYTAAGLGLFVSTTIPQNVRFSADAEFHSRWTDLVIHGGAINEGGVGVLVSEGGNTIARKDAKLWGDYPAGVGSPWFGASGDNVTLLTQTAAGQTYFHMVPGRQYVVWVWCWVVTHTLGSVFAFAEIEAHMPFVVVEQQH
jgi:hypothetical protein